MATKETLLSEVKSHLGILSSDSDLDKNIQLKIDAVCMYLETGGAILEDVEQNIAAHIVNCIAIGVNDLMNDEAGETKFSPAFTLFAQQICRR